MREILFRGQRIDNGEWVYGLLRKSREKDGNTLTGNWIYWIDSHEEKIGIWIVNHKSIGQFTGLLDKNGNKIFEGHLVRWTNGKHYWEAVISTLPNSKTNTLYAIETYCNLSTYFDEFDEEIYSFERTDERKGIRNELEFLSKNIEIIGNIHEKK